MAPPGAGPDKVDIEEELKKMRKSVYTNVALFAAVCVVLRLSEYDFAIKGTDEEEAFANW